MAGMVMVALSGGVDSAVAALRLLDAGHRVEALHMTNWEEPDGSCPAADDLRAAEEVANELGLVLHRLNFAEEYRREVFESMLSECRAGRTPNPDVGCNRRIKFGACLRMAGRLGAERLATGHHARLERTGGSIRLLRGKDPKKDQSYFLHAVRGEAFEHCLFPVGELDKKQVRAMARRRGLPNYERPDSTGICFVGERAFPQFIARYIPARPGPIVTIAGDHAGEHAGLAAYTIGQRRGLRLGGIKRGGPEPWHVVRKDLNANALVVAQGHDHPLLYSRRVEVRGLRWINGAPAAFAKGARLSAKTRYRQNDADCRARLLAPDRCLVRFDTPQWAVTPGQYLVFYNGQECLGGGVIERAEA
ncbi:MAG: tRNA 2-thiouridine(34) synthase MnmA [Gammaproteobacteria bacterium]|nr:tRNA 2-thiouridine(34) synthase MnmA [Gammaproteobacteria bacterium]